MQIAALKILLIILCYCLFLSEYITISLIPFPFPQRFGLAVQSAKLYVLLLHAVLVLFSILIGYLFYIFVAIFDNALCLDRPKKKEICHDIQKCNIVCGLE